MRRAAAVVALALALAAGAPAQPRVTQVRVGAAPYRVTAIGRTLWVSVYGPGDVVRLDPATGRVVRRYRVGGGPGSLAVAGGSVWIGNYAASPISCDVEGKALGGARAEQIEDLMGKLR